MTGFVNALAGVIVAVGLNGVWLGLLLAAFAALIVRILPRSNAATRYTVWFTALLLVLIMPMVLPLIPRAAAIPVPAQAAAIHWNVPVTVAWPVYVVLAWLLITGMLLLRVGWSLVHIAHLKRDATVIGSRGNIRLLASRKVRVPMAAGFLRRAILFPQWLLAELTPEEFDQILCHELAHLRRADDWTQLFQAVMQALFFFNPAIYWISRGLKIEREMACDDWVVAATGRARPYAACLTHLHELTRRASAPQLAAGATARTRWQISARIEALLRPDRAVAPRFAPSGWMAAAALVSAALLIAAEIPPPFTAQPLPLASIRMASLPSPQAPAIFRIAESRPPAEPVRHRLFALRRSAPVQPMIPAPPLLDPPTLLVNWQFETPPSSVIITLIFFEPPPPPAMHRI